MCDLWWRPSMSKPTRSLSNDSSHLNTTRGLIVSSSSPSTPLSTAPDTQRLADGMYNNSAGSNTTPLVHSPAQHHNLLPESEYPSSPEAEAEEARRRRRQSTVAAVMQPPESRRVGTSRIVLSISLLAQVTLQWTWAIVLFVSPIYNQPSCSKETTLMMFLYPVTVKNIIGHSNTIPVRNSTSTLNTITSPVLATLPDHPHISIAIWPLWLVFCLTVTTAYGIILVLRATEFAEAEHNPSLSRSTSRSTLRRVSTVAGIAGKALWIPFPNVPPATSTPLVSHLTHGVSSPITRWPSDTSESTSHGIIYAGAPTYQKRRVNAKWIFQRAVNRLAAFVQRTSILVWVGIVFLLPPTRPRPKESAVAHKARLRVWIGNAIAVLIVLVFVVCEYRSLIIYYLGRRGQNMYSLNTVFFVRLASEAQINWLNCIVTTSSSWSFGQVRILDPKTTLRSPISHSWTHFASQMAAILLALAPAWALVETIWQYPQHRQKRAERRRKLREAKKETNRLKTGRISTLSLSLFHRMF